MKKQRNVRTSIIIPVYNTKQYLETCIESALAQTQKEIEIILVDDGSTDGSTQIISSYEAKYPFVKAIYQSNQKLGAARNAGAKAAIGKYIYFLDSDDYVCKDLCERCYKIAESEGLDFVMFDAFAAVEGDESMMRTGSTKEEYGREHMGIEEKVYSGVEFWEKFYSVKGIYSNAYLVYMNTDFYRNHKLDFIQGVFYEDMDWVVRLYACAKKIKYIPQKLYYRRIHAGSIMTVEFNDIHIKSSLLISRKLMHMLVDEEELPIQRMMLYILDAMIERSKIIFDIYCQGARLGNVWFDLLDFYQDMLSVYERLCKIRKSFEIELLLLAEKIRDELRNEKPLLEVPSSELKKYKWNLVVEDFQEFSLGQKEKVVGIYGTGLMCNKLLSLYRQNAGEITATIFFIDSYKMSGDKYLGYPLYNIKDINGMEIDNIIIMSNRYKEEMLENVQKYCMPEVKVLYIPKLINVLYKNNESIIGEECEC